MVLDGTGRGGSGGGAGGRRSSIQGELSERKWLKDFDLKKNGGGKAQS